MIYTVITKPTKECNADCTYCSAPPDGVNKWSIDDFKDYFDRLKPYLGRGAVFIWHGGEPMLMGPEFYLQAYEYAQARAPQVRFSIQTNLLSYSSKRWFDVFAGVFKGSISTSFDPDEQHREYKGSTAKYTQLFFDRLNDCIADGFQPMVIGTYTEATAHLGHQMYDISRAYGDRGFPLRFNYRYPAGREAGAGEVIQPATYGRMLLDLYNRWIEDIPAFTITPLDQMLLKVTGAETARCPWVNSCGGRFIGLEPNGDIYNCADFADLNDPKYCFGNLREKTVPELMASEAAREIRRRRYKTPATCQACRHYDDCEGGCARDSVLYDHGIYGKFHYCLSWTMVFDRIKESIHTGEADRAMIKFGLEPEIVRADLVQKQSLAA